jgi:hypothetical protein
MVQLSVVLDEAQIEAEKKHGRRPHELVEWRNYHIGDAEIDQRREALLEKGHDPEVIEEEYLDAKARYEASLRAADDWDERTGVAPLRAALDRANDADYEAAERLAETPPSTPAGAAAVIEYVLNDDIGQCDWHEVALKTVIQSLRTWGEVRS